MSFYERFILPPLINLACSTKPIMKQREKVVPQAEGVVLEVGAGTGTNFGYYQSDKVKKLIALEPAEGMVKRGEKTASRYPDLDISYLQEGAEAMSLETDSVDTAVLTFTLCTIPDWRSALEDVRRVLKPGGRVLFAEHGGSPDPNIAKWQRRWEPIQKVIGGGCHVTRIPTKMLTETGFRIDQNDTMYLPSTPKVLGYNYWGQASIA